jgi:hypothetical protein
MQERARQARNAQRLAELHSAFARRMQRIIAALESDGYRPRIQDGWRSPQSQLEAFERGNSKLKFGFHNATAANGRPESLAVDLLDDDFPLNPRSDYLLHLAAAALATRCQTGIAWGLPTELRRSIATAISNKDWNARLKIGWDPTHVEPADVTVAEARAGKRPTEMAGGARSRPVARAAPRRRKARARKGR